MAEIKIKSKRYGELLVLLDDDDLNKLKNDFKNMKWNITKNRNKLYAQKRTSDGKIYLHTYITNCPKGYYVDHINHNTLDNRKSNLRIVCNADNLRNGYIRSNNKSGINGVYFDKSRNKYVASIKVNYKKIFLGRFENIEDAIQQRKEAETKYWETKENYDK